MGLKLLTWIAALWGIEKLSDEGIEIELEENKMEKDNYENGKE